jgi:type I restriction enzyme S subunit
MGYQAYADYKESGVEWLPDIPKHWKIRRLKFMTTIQNGRDYKEVESDEGFPVIGSGGQFTFASDFLYDGESVLFGRKGTIDKPLHISGKFWTVDTMFYSIIHPDVFGRYLYYFSTIFQYERLATQTALPSITQHDLGNYLLCYPLLSEQEVIAKFLDHKTAQIDRLIEKKQELIEKLQEQRITLITHAVTKGLDSDAPLKDSGVKCLGQIPENWKTLRLRYCTKFVTSGSRGWAEFFTEDGSPFLRITNLDRNSINLLISDLQRVSPPDSTEGERTETSAGDVLISITADLGSVAVIPKNLEKSYVSQHIALIRPEKEKILSKWLAYSVFSTPGKSQLLGAGYGGTKIQLSLGDIKELYITLPPTLDLQEKIITKTETRLEQLNNIVATTTLAISSLQEYRTALITAAVTGQIDVRDWQAPEACKQSAQDKDVA